MPANPFHLDILMNIKSGSKKIYEAYSAIESQKPGNSTSIWSNLTQNEWINMEDDKKWIIIYKICHFTILDNDVKWFQYRVINNILGTNYYQTRVKVKKDSKCSFCHSFDETIEHLFSECEEVNQLWSNVEGWISNKLKLNLRFTKMMKILGYLTIDQYFWPLNLILLVTRKYIFWCSKKNFKLNIYFLQSQVQQVYIEQETLSLINMKSDLFKKRWNFWSNIFNGIDN